MIAEVVQKWSPRGHPCNDYSYDNNSGDFRVVGYFGFPQGESGNAAGMATRITLKTQHPEPVQRERQFPPPPFRLTVTV